MKKIGFLIAMLMFFSTVVKSEVYKWVDSNGQVHYTDKPQQKSKKAVELGLKTDIAPQESARAQAKLRALQKQQKETARRNEIKNGINQQKRTNALRKKTIVRKNCGYAKRNIKILKSKSWAPIRRGSNPVGASYVTVKQRPAEIKKNQDYIDRNC